MALSWLPLVRLIVFGTVIFFSIIVLGVSANLISLTEPGFFTFSALALAVSLITLFVIVPTLVVDFLRQGAIFSWVLFELVAFSVLWVLWLATAAQSSADDVAKFLFEGGCGFFIRGTATACRSWSAVQAFAYLNWIIIMAYTGLLLVLVIMNIQRGKQGAWKASVRDEHFFLESSVAPTTAPMMQHPASASIPMAVTNHSGLATPLSPQV